MGERPRIDRTIDDHAGYALRLSYEDPVVSAPLLAPIIMSSRLSPHRPGSDPPRLLPVDNPLPLPQFGAHEDIMLAPSVFSAMCQNLRLSPQIDLFATAQHHQLPRYLSPRAADPNAFGHDAFAYHWPTDAVLYANPPPGPFWIR